MLKKDDKEKFKKSLIKKLSANARVTIFKNIIKACQSVKTCEFCLSFNGKVTHQTGTDATLIVHDKFK